MLIRKPRAFDLPEREATPEPIFMNRRELLAQSLPLGAGLAGFASSAARAEEEPALEAPTAGRYPARRNAELLLDVPLTREQPRTFWTTIAPDEYDFVANVDPEVPHPPGHRPRRSCSTARRDSGP